MNLPDIIMNIGVLTNKKVIVKYSKKYDRLRKFNISNVNTVANENNPFLIECCLDNFDYRKMKILVLPL